LNGVTDATGNSGNVIGPQMGLLVGDVNANGLVNSTDTSQVQAQSGQPVTGDLGTGNYRKDVNANGLINSTDTSTVQSKSGHGLPSTP
jgi:membrane protease subunit (stomatin/prohibitin family)